MNLSKYIGEQFKKPTGKGGKVSSFFMNRLNKLQYKSVINYVKEACDEDILDIGFGNGYLINKVAKIYNNNRVYGIDISEDMLKVASIKNKEFIENGQVNLLLADVENLSFEDNKFNRIYTVNTLYFWNNPNRALKEINRVLKNNGIFINCFYTEEWLNKIRYTKYGFNKYSLEKILKVYKANGIEVEEIIELKKDSSYCLISRK